MEKKQLTFDLDIKRQTTFTLDDVNIETDIKVDITFIDKQEDLKIALNWLKFAPKLVGVDIETRGLDPHQHEMIMCQLGDEHRQFVIDTRVVDITEVIDYLLVDDITIVGQNLKFEYKFIKHKFNKELINCHDTMLQEICLYNGYGMHNSLKALAKRYLNYEADKSIRMRFLEIGDDPFSKDEIVYGAFDVILPILISKVQREKITDKGMEVLSLLENNYLKVIGDMEYKGLYFSTEKWMELYNENLPIFEEKKDDLDQFIIDNNLTKWFQTQTDLFGEGRKVNIMWTSSYQVINLFKDLGICPQAVSKATKKLAYTVEAKVLKTSLNTINKNTKDSYKELIKMYLEMKEYGQRVTTFGEAFLKYVNPITGRLHSNINQIVSTGRSSSRSPNLQNIPSDPRYRMCFTAPEDHKIVNADYSGQETVVLANKSLEPNMIKLIKEGGDMHSFIARYVFPELKELSDKEIKSNHSDKRQIAKAAGFAIAYGGTGFTIANNLGISEKQGNKVYDAYFEAFPNIREYLDKAIENTLSKGYIEVNEVTNRRLNLSQYKTMMNMGAKLNALTKEQKGKYFRLKSAISRLSLNVPIQGTAGDITKNASIRFRNWIYENNHQDLVFITNIIHDEINVECPEDISKLVATNLTKCMEEAGALWCKTVPLKADSQIKNYWTH